MPAGDGGLGLRAPVFTAARVSGLAIPNLEVPWSQLPLLLVENEVRERSWT